MSAMTLGDGYCYFRAAGRSLDAISVHQRAVAKAIEDVRAFVMLCGAERALGNSQISGLVFSGRPPVGWMRNASAPHMAIPDIDTQRGISLARKMADLHIPGDAEFAGLIGAEPLASTDDPTIPLLMVSWPDYVRLKDGWAIRCPLNKRGGHATPPDALPLTRADYERLVVSPHFNLVAFDSENSSEN
jgi:hypothetical protein